MSSAFLKDDFEASAQIAHKLISLEPDLIQPYKMLESIYIE